jgi:hypothetical protein
MEYKMSSFIQINKTTTIPTDTIRFIRPIGDEERTRIAERYGADAGEFNVSIQFGDKTTKLALETVEQLREQGVSLVDIGGDRHVVAANIKSAKPFTAKDAAKIEERGYNLSQDFKSRVETTAGAVLSSATPTQIMDRRARAKEGGSQAAPQLANG